MKKNISLLFFILLVTACNQPGCHNTNEILKKGKVDSWQYQTELMRLIDQHPADVTYYFERRARISDNSFIVMKCYGKDFCGELKTLFSPKNIPSLKLQNEGGWQGAKLVGVGFHRVQLADGHEVFSFDKLQKIVD